MKSVSSGVAATEHQERFLRHKTGFAFDQGSGGLAVHLCPEEASEAGLHRVGFIFRNLIL